MRKTRRLLLISALVCVLSLSFMAVVLAMGPRQIVRFTPPGFDVNAVSGTPDLSAADGYRPIDADVYQFSICGELYLTDLSCDVWLTNPESNNVWLKVALKDSEDNLLGQTGLIRPGEYVQSLTLTQAPEKSMDVKMLVMGYEPDSYYSAGNVSLYTYIHVPE